MKRNHIRIVVRGRLGDRLASSFEGMTLVASRGITELHGHDLDQAQLHGILSRIRDLGLELVSVTSTDVEPDGHAGPT
jgi:hypothetical protein